MKVIGNIKVYTLFEYTLLRTKYRWRGRRTREMNKESAKKNALERSTGCQSNPPSLAKLLSNAIRIDMVSQLTELARQTLSLTISTPRPIARSLFSPPPLINTPLSRARQFYRNFHFAFASPFPQRLPSPYGVSMPSLLPAKQ